MLLQFSFLGLVKNSSASFCFLCTVFNQIFESKTSLWNKRRGKAAGTKMPDFLWTKLRVIMNTVFVEKVLSRHQIFFYLDGATFGYLNFTLQHCWFIPLDHNLARIDWEESNERIFNSLYKNSSVKLVSSFSCSKTSFLMDGVIRSRKKTLDIILE